MKTLEKLPNTAIESIINGERTFDNLANAIEEFSVISSNREASYGLTILASIAEEMFFEHGLLSDAKAPLAHHRRK